MNKKVIFGSILLLISGLTIEVGSCLVFRRVGARFSVVDPHRLALAPGQLGEARHQYSPDLGWDGEPEGRPDSGRYEHLKMICFGDSFTWCDEVEDDQTWPCYPAELLGGEVRNFGVNGYGTDQSYLRFRKYYAANPAPLVVLGLVSVDMPRCLSVYRRFYFPRSSVLVTKPRFILQEGGLRLLEHPIHNEAELRKLMDTDFLLHLGETDAWAPRPDDPVLAFPYTRLLFNRQVWRQMLSNLQGRPADEIRPSVRCAEAWNDPEARRLFFSILDAFERDVRIQGATPVIILFPTKDEIQSVAAGMPAPLRFTSDYLEAHHYAYFNSWETLSEALAHGEQVGKLYRSAHLSSRGNRLVANGFYNYLSSHPASGLSASGPN